LLDRLLERGQVDLAEGALVHHGVDAEALACLVVDGLVLE
jgi:hypothetical protein